jgi:hypothetical protein
VNVSGATLVTGNSTILLQGKNNTADVGGQWLGVGVTVAAGSVQVDSGSRISADAQGYATSLGPGGASGYTQGGTHGGRGTDNTKPTYGSYLAPADLGSAGGGAYTGTSAGGGAIRLMVGGTLTNNGAITANGWASAGGNNGGGAGGSIHVTTGTIVGGGVFQANGSAGINGAGGGGRVAIHYALDGGFSRTSVTASAGGTGATAGSVYLLENSANLYVPTALALPNDASASYTNVTVYNGATLALGGGSTITVTSLLRVTGNATLLVQSKNNTAQVGGTWQGAGATITAGSVQVDNGSRISADAQGYTTGAGPGAATTYIGGGTHGGQGSNNAASTYGSYLAPVDLGSGGGGAYGGTSAGGGAIRLIVGGTLSNNGAITANGWASVGGNKGGGAGGSLHITAGTIAGGGVFSANGAGPFDGNGGGGRVAIHYTTDGGFNRTLVTASAGGTGATAGSVHLLENGANLYVPTALALPPDTSVTYGSVTVYNGATLTLGGGATLSVSGALRVTGNATLLVQSKNAGGQVGGTWQGAGATITAGSVQVDSGSQISADAQGYTAFMGPGGASSAYAGGTYGGSGEGNMAATYGSQLAPIDLGSGGGGVYGGWSVGGGAIRLTVGGTLTNNGTITANGWASAGGNNGGGAGGSIYITTATLSGAGTITASGGVGTNADGGGGRIAIYYGTSTFPKANITASAGGAGATAGTVALVISPPTLTSVSPAAAPVGTAVTLTGTGFTWATEVRFNAAVQPVFTIVSDTQITTTVPASAATGPVQVVTAGGTATSVSHFVVIPPPTLTGVAPGSGPVGTAVTLTGTGFTWATAVRFGGVAQPTFTVVSATQITTTVPAGAASGPVQVVNPAGTATSAASFTVIPPPTLTGVSPTSGPVGTAVTLTGTGFTWATLVRFGATAQPAFTVVSATQITTTVPTGATTGAVQVVNPAGTATSAATFTVIVAPTLTSVSPPSGLPDAPVVLAGSGFSGASSVRFNGVPAVFFVINDAQVTAYVPVTATTGPVEVQAPGGTVTSAVAFTVVPRCALPGASDYDGDGLDDPAVYRAMTASWYELVSSGPPRGVPWGLPTDVPVPADYDGDGRADETLYRHDDSLWFMRLSGTGGAVAVAWGAFGDIPVPADYDGDGQADVAVFRPATSVWYILQSRTRTAVGLRWGALGDIPVPADYDGDGKADVAVFRPSTGTWYQLRSQTGTAVGLAWGQAGDLPLAADYDGDGQADPTLFRASAGTWFQLRSHTGTPVGVVWGVAGDRPMVGDYDGDGLADPTVYRPATGMWFQLRSHSGGGHGVSWGNATDTPL